MTEKFPLHYPKGRNDCPCCINNYSKGEFVGIKWTDEGPKKFTYTPKMANEPTVNSRESSLSSRREGRILEINGTRTYYINGSEVSKHDFSKAYFL